MNESEPIQDSKNKTLQQIEDDINLLKEKLEPIPKAIERFELIYERMYSFSGPLPHPDILEGYDKIVPGAAERIIDMAENEQKHRISMDEKSISNAVIIGYLGIIFAFISVLLISGLFYFSLSKGSDMAAIALAITAMASVAGVFVFYRKKNKQKD